jgi:hypothetical protein
MTRFAQRNGKLLAALIAVVLALITGWLFYMPRISLTTQTTLTRFLFSQLTQNYGAHLASGHEAAASADAFLELVPHWSIDWNSCSYRNGSIYDSWEQKVEILIDSGEIHLRSAGPDLVVNTADDISFEFPDRRKK